MNTTQTPSAPVHPPADTATGAHSPRRTVTALLGGLTGRVPVIVPSRTPRLRPGQTPGLLDHFTDEQRRRVTRACAELLRAQAEAEYDHDSEGMGHDRALTHDGWLMTWGDLTALRDNSAILLLGIPVGSLEELAVRVAVASELSPAQLGLRPTPHAAPAYQALLQAFVARRPFAGEAVWTLTPTGGGPELWAGVMAGELVVWPTRTTEDLRQAHVLAPDHAQQLLRLLEHVR